MHSENYLVKNEKNLCQFDQIVIFVKNLTNVNVTLRIYKVDNTYLYFCLSHSAPPFIYFL